MTYQLKAIGKVKNDETGTFIQLEPGVHSWTASLKGLQPHQCPLVVQRLRQRCRPK